MTFDYFTIVIRMQPPWSEKPEARFMSGSLSDFKLERSIRNKRYSLSSFPALTPITESSIFEHFLIVGAPPVAPVTGEPDILLMFPSSPLYLSETEFNQTAKMCFPKGFGPVPRPSGSYSPFLSQFVFQLNGTVLPTYCACAHFLLPPKSNVFFSAPNTLDYPFCFCLLSTTPILTSHFEFLTYLIYRSVAGYKQYVPPTLPHELFTPPSDGETYPGLQVLSGIARWPGMKVLKPFRQDLIFYKTLKPNRSTEAVYELTHSIALHIPQKLSDSEHIANFCLDVLFSYLSVENIIKVYAALLLETHVIFVCSDPHVLTLCVLSARSILKPFSVEVTLMPVLTSTYYDLIESPVPYIFGLLETSCLMNRQLPERLCLVDIIRNRVTLRHSMPDLPNSTFLINRINHVIDEHRMEVECPKKYLENGETNPAFVQFLLKGSGRPSMYLGSLEPKYIFNKTVITKLLQAFSEHIAGELESLVPPCFVTDSSVAGQPVTVFNSDLFLDSVEHDQVAFYAEFIETSVFQKFCDGKTDELDMIKASIYDSYGDFKSEGSEEKLIPSSFDPSILTLPVIFEEKL